MGRGVKLMQAFPFYACIFIFYLHSFFTFSRFFKQDRALQFIGVNVMVLTGMSVLMFIIGAVQSNISLTEFGVETSFPQLLSLQSINVEMLIVAVLILIPSFVYYHIKKQLQSKESLGFRLLRNKEAELAQLQSQVNPHFLFNTLNTLYALALKEGSEKTAECIAKLANLMRFMLDDMGKETIPLQREINYIQDYVKLQSIRSAVEHNINILIDVEKGIEFSIAPMLLIPFVENAFKHGMNPNKVSQLNINIKAQSNRIQFVIENSIDNDFEAYYKEKGFGIGIENVKSRLNYIYPGQHTISVAKTNVKFIVIIEITGNWNTNANPDLNESLSIE
jgi:sensor histidine kinase YesM